MNVFDEVKRKTWNKEQMKQKSVYSLPVPNEEGASHVSNLSTLALTFLTAPKMEEIGWSPNF